MAEDKILKSGQFTFARLLFLVAAGTVIFGIVALGGKFLSIGYILLTLAICGLLYLIAIDYGVKMDKVDTSGHSQNVSTEPTLTNGSVAEDLRPRRKSAKAGKRRR
ncbi:MAG: hypothetical protein HY231_25635 [Acidobacteria bacterium]|nr:hypothetical protein [Acidobacteriota bacterium]